MHLMLYLSVLLSILMTKLSEALKFIFSVICFRTLDMILIRKVNDLISKGGSSTLGENKSISKKSG